MFFLRISPGQQRDSLLFTVDQIVDFLFRYLEEYGDEKDDIEAAVNYSLSDNPQQGGGITVAYEENRILGVVVMLKTGMSGYIPENILVYIAVRTDIRGKGIGQNMMENVIQSTEGNIALHVEPHNPAKKLYEKMGFTNKYLEMRFIR